MEETGKDEQYQPPPFGPPAELTQKEAALNCPRCSSTNIKFCYYNNYRLSQSRYFCKTCRRYWTEHVSLRNIPVGDGQHQRPFFVSPAEARPGDSSSGKDTLADLDLGNNLDVIDWGSLASLFGTPDRGSLISPLEHHLPVSNSFTNNWVGNSPNTAMAETTDIGQRQILPLEPHLPLSNFNTDIPMSNSPNTAMEESRDIGQHQISPLELPAKDLPIRNSGNYIRISGQQRQAPLFQPPADTFDLSSGLPSSFTEIRRFRSTVPDNNIRYGPAGGKKRQRRTEEEKKEAHRMASIKYRLKVKARNENIRNRYQMLKKKQIEMLHSYELVNKYKEEDEAARMMQLPMNSDIHHTAELFTSQNHGQNVQANTVGTGITACGPDTENLEVGNPNNEIVNGINLINAMFRRRELLQERLRNVATKSRQLLQFPGEMQNMLGMVGGSISRLAKEGETMNVEDLERQIQQVEDNFHQRLQEMRNKYFDHDKDSSHTSMFSFENVQDFLEKYREDISEFEGFAEEFERSWRFNLRVPCFVPAHENQVDDDYGDIADQSTLLITDSYVLLCSVIKEMNQLPLEHINLSIIILWRDAISSGLGIGLEEHLKKIAKAFCWFYFKRK